MIKTLIGGFVGACLLLIGRVFMRNRGSQNDTRDAVSLETEEGERRVREAAIREAKQRADAAAQAKIDARPHTDDPVADLEARLGNPDE